MVPVDGSGDAEKQSGGKARAGGEDRQEFSEANHLRPPCNCVLGISSRSVRAVMATPLAPTEV